MQIHLSSKPEAVHASYHSPQGIHPLIERPQRQPQKRAMPSSAFLQVDLPIFLFEPQMEKSSKCK